MEGSQRAVSMRRSLSDLQVVAGTKATASLSDSFRQICVNVADLTDTLPRAVPPARKSIPSKAAQPASYTAPTLPIYDELANALSHGLGLLLAVAGAATLLAAAFARGDVVHVVGCGVYAMTMMTLYGASTVYHALPRGERKTLFQAFDHAAIYLFIAGTYTPYMLILLGGVWSWVILGAVWTIAVGGIVQKIRSAGRLHATSALPYAAMGWLVLAAARPVAQAFPTGAILWLLAGGICYTLGIYFFVNGRKPLYHAVWHLFVMGGSACHFVGIIWYVMPPAA